VNAWNNGIAWGLIKNGNIIKWRPERPRLREIDGLYYRSVVLSQKYGKWRPERPRLREIDGLYYRSVVLSQKYGKLKRLGLHKTREGKGLWREVRRLRRRIYAKLRDYAQRLAHRLVRKALRHRALVIIDDIIEESRRELLEMKIPSGLRKIYLAETRRFVKLLVTQLQWYGVPYEFKRLPSTVCPICGHKLIQERGRIMVCTNCGFKTPRDKVPMYWVVRAMPKAKVGSP